MPPVVAAGASLRAMKIDTVSVEFTDEQKRYLEGFTTGLQISRVGRSLGAGAGQAKVNAEPVGPDAAHIKAQDRVLASGRKLADQEKFKREEHPFDAYPRLKQQASTNSPPSPADNFRWRYHGLFYVAPAQDSYMCRLRIPNGVLKHWQFAGMADLAERLCGPYCHVTTRANLQVREVPPKNAVALIEGIQDLGLCSRGSGADNIRNVTGTPTAGIDPQELIDTRQYAREWHFHILNDRSLYGLPRKFNVAFDGAGKIAVLEDTNDIAFAAVEVRDGFGVEPCLRPDGTYRRAQAKTARFELDRRFAAARQSDLRTDAQRGQNCLGPRRRRNPPHRVAEFADLGRGGRQDSACNRCDRGGRSCGHGVTHSRRIDRVYR